MGITKNSSNKSNLDTKFLCFRNFNFNILRLHSTSGSLLWMQLLYFFSQYSTMHILPVMQTYKCRYEDAAVIMLPIELAEVPH